MLVSHRNVRRMRIFLLFFNISSSVCSRPCINIPREECTCEMVGWDRSREGCSCEEEAKKGRRIGGDGEDRMRLSSRARGKGGIGGGVGKKDGGRSRQKGDRVVGIWRHPPIGVALGGKVVSCRCMCATGRYVTVMDGRKCRCQGGCSRGISCPSLFFMSVMMDLGCPRPPSS